MTNLIDNAAKYSKPTTTVTIKASYKDTINNVFDIYVTLHSDRSEIVYEKYDVPEEEFTLIDIILNADGTLTFTLVNE